VKILLFIKKQSKLKEGHLSDNDEFANEITHVAVIFGCVKCNKNRAVYQAALLLALTI
jgi:hypothetical protein